MTELFALVNGLNSEETKAVRSSFKRVNAEEECFYLENLFSLIGTQKEVIIPDVELSISIYGQEKLSAIAKLKSRLFYYVLDILSSEAMIAREHFLDTSDRQIIRLRKKMLQFRVLYRKKNKVEASVLFHLLSEIVKEAKDCEQYDVLVEALSFKKSILMIRKGFSEIPQIEKLIEAYHYAYRAILKTNDHYFELFMNQELLQQIKPDKLCDMRRHAMREMEEFISVTNSASVKYFYKRIQLDDMLKEGKIQHTIDVCLDMLSILNQHKHLYRSERIGFVYDNISMCHVHKSNFDDAISSAKKAQEYYSEGSFNFMISKQQEFLACFYGSAYQRANVLIAELLEFPIMNAGEFRHDKYLLFEASTLFKLGKPRKALAICNQALEVTKDKGRWDLGVRYLRIMCMIELQDHDAAYSAIEALRKAIKRNEKGSISLRDEIVYRAFNEFASTGFSNTPTNKLIEIIQELSLGSTVHSWNYYTHELIPVHKWIESKIREKKSAPGLLALK